MSKPRWCKEHCTFLEHMELDLCKGVDVIHVSSPPEVGKYTCTGSAHLLGVHALCICECHITYDYMKLTPWDLTAFDKLRLKE